MQIEVSMTGRLPEGTGDVRCTLTFDPDNFAVSRQGLGRVLNLPFNVTGATQVHQQGDLFVGAKVEVLSVTGWLGSSSSAWNVIIPQHVVTGETNGSLVVPLGDGDLEAIEDLRSGNEVRLNVWINGLARVTAVNPLFLSTAQQWTAPKPYYRSEIVALKSDNSPYHGGGTAVNIRRERWLELLAQAGRTRMLMELAMPALPNVKPWEEVARLLNVTEGYHRTGHYEVVPEKCREILEGLLQILATQWNIPKPTGDGFEKWTKEVSGRLKTKWPSADIEQADSVSLLLNAGWLWSRSSHHFGTGIPKREEAAFILHLTTNLFAFCVQLAEAYPDPLVARE